MMDPLTFVGRFGGVGKEGASADFAEEMKDTRV